MQFALDRRRAIACNLHEVRELKHANIVHRQRIVANSSSSMRQATLPLVPAR
jgi:hypothetical protein